MINCFLKTISIEENIESKSIKIFFSFLSSIRIGYMFFLKKPFAHVGIYPLANDIFAVLDCFCFCSQSLLHCKKKWKINACAKIISGIKVNVIYSVMYAIRNFLNGNDNWYSF